MSSQLKEVLFFISTTLSLIETVKIIPETILYRCLKTALDKSRLPRFERFKYLKSIDILTELLTHKLPRSIPYVLSILVSLILTIIYFLGYGVLFLAAYVYIGVEIYNHPAFPSLISNFILVYGLITVLLAFTFQLLFTLVPFRRDHPKLVRQFGEVDRRDGRISFWYDLGRREVRGKNLFMKLALSRRKLLYGLDTLEQLALWDKLARNRLSEDRRRKKGIHF